MNGQTDLDEGQEDGGVRTYVAILIAALLVGLGLAVYVAGYRDEILAIIFQSPT